MEKVTLEHLYREIKLLRKDVAHLKRAFVSEVAPEQDGIEAVRMGRRDFKTEQHAEWNKLKK